MSYTPQASGSFIIDEIVVDIIVEDELTLDADICKTDKSVSMNYLQKFGITYKVNQKSSTDLRKSGNPGYQKGLPLLVGQSEISGSKKLHKDGFLLYSRNSKGKCFTN